jgi:excinuclease UvrABC nuclease subunit
VDDFASMREIVGRRYKRPAGDREAELVERQT